MLVHFGWMAILLACIAGAATMLRWPMKARQSYSENVARERSSRRTFAAWMTVVTLLFYWFLLHWLGPARGMGAGYYAVVWCMFICQLVLAWVPATHGRAMLVHNITSYGLALLMPVLLIILAITSMPALHMFQMAAVVAFVGYEAIVMCLFFFQPAARRYFLWFQISLMLAVWATVLIVAHG